MDDLTKRLLMFFIGCMAVRFSFVVIAKKIDKNMLPYLAIPAIILSMAWLNIYFFNPRNSGPETFGKPIWWNELRIAHALLYLLFAIYALQKKSFSYLPLLADVLLGFTSSVLYHFVL